MTASRGEIEQALRPVPGRATACLCLLVIVPATLRAQELPVLCRDRLTGRPLAGAGHGRRAGIAQYIVGIDGKAEPGSFRALIANDKYAREAQRAIAAADFRPAEYCGTPVRQGVQQRIVFASAGP